MLSQIGTPAPTSRTVYRVWKGDGYICIGLAVQFEHMLLDYLQSTKRPFNGMMPPGLG